MWSKSANKKASTVDTLIGEQTELHGDVKFSGGLYVKGTIRGNIISDPDSGSTLSLSESGVIEGEVRVPNLELNGTISGDVYASEHIHLAANARVKGNVYYKVMEMVRGAEVNGNLIRYDEESRKALPRGGQGPAEKVITADS